MNEPTLASASTEFKDRRNGLVVFGVLEIILGGFCILAVALILLALTLLSGQGPAGGMTFQGPNAGMTGMAVATYTVLGAAFIWLGIGSIRCRRWARALLLVGAWSWLVAGICALGFYLAFGRALALQDAPDSVAGFVMGFLIIFQLVFFVAVPGAMVIFYQNRHVKATCEARDPVARWTDSCPLTVLGTALWLAIGAVSFLGLPLWSRGVVPLFGTLVTGAPAVAILLACAVLMLALAWGIYRLKIAAWWGALIAFTLSSLSAGLTFLRVDLMELYRQLGYPEDQIRLIRESGVLTGTTVVLWTALFYVAFVAYSIGIKKHFQH